MPLDKRKSTEPESFVLKTDSLLLTVGDLGKGDFSQDFSIVSKNPTPNLQAIGIALGVNAVRHVECAGILLQALQVYIDRETWEAEGNAVGYDVTKRDVSQLLQHWGFNKT